MMDKGREDKYGEYGRLPDNVFETYNPGVYPAGDRTTNALVFPLKLMDGVDILSGQDLSHPVENKKPADG